MHSGRVALRSSLRSWPRLGTGGAWPGCPLVLSCGGNVSVPCPLPGREWVGWDTFASLSMWVCMCVSMGVSVGRGMSDRLVLESLCEPGSVCECAA